MTNPAIHVRTKKTIPRGLEPQCGPQPKEQILGIVDSESRVGPEQDKPNKVSTARESRPHRGCKTIWNKQELKGVTMAPRLTIPPQPRHLFYDLHAEPYAIIATEDGRFGSIWQTREDTASIR
eukprot:1414680-Rhodomonas_salina.2